MKLNRLLQIAYYMEQLGNLQDATYLRDVSVLLKSAQSLRPQLLAQQHFVPECVLDYCNKARAITK